MRWHEWLPPEMSAQLFAAQTNGGCVDCIEASGQSLQNFKSTLGKILLQTEARSLSAMQILASQAAENCVQPFNMSMKQSRS
jgi:hypothetical protein